MSDELKPCPLCGSEWRWNEPDDRGQTMFYVRCLGRDCNCAVYGLTRQEVVDRVNRRTPGPATAKLLAKFAWFLERFAGVDDLEVPIKREMAAASIAEHEPARPAVASEPLPPEILEYQEGQT